MENSYVRKKTLPIISFDLFKSFGNDIPDEDEKLCELFLRSAELSVEQATNRVLIASDYDLTVYGPHPIGAAFRILRSPLNSITSVHQDGVALEYQLQKTEFYSIIYFGVISQTKDINVVFNAGYKETPANLQEAVLKTALFNYTNRGDVTPDGMSQIPLDVLPIINKTKITPI